MARLQILELPEGSGDDRPPFVLVIDQWTSGEYVPYANAAQQTGARGVLVFEDTVDIPANDVPLDENGHPLFLKMHIEGDFEQFRAQVQDEIRKAQAELRDALNSSTGRSPEE